MQRLAFATFAPLALLLGTACADTAQDDLLQDSAEVQTASCGAERYNEALQHYKNAVEWSRQRLQHGVCESEHGSLWNIADEASRAVMTCDAFRTTIRTSPWAAPIRQALAPSLNLRSYTGELLVIRDSQWQNWSGVENFFTAGGLSFWANGQGAYGPPVRIDFHADGAATWGNLWHDDTTGDILWQSTPATYTVEHTTTTGNRTLRVTHDGVEEVFTLGVDNPFFGYKDAPRFKLVPNDAQSTTPVLYSFVSECDA